MAGVSLLSGRAAGWLTRPGGPCTFTPISPSPSPSRTSSPTACRSSATPSRGSFWVVIWASTARRGARLPGAAAPVAHPLPPAPGGRGPRARARASSRSYCPGHHIDRLPVAGGQFLQWRFLRRGMWWQAHPYSISALRRAPMPPRDGQRPRVTSPARSPSLPSARGSERIEGPYGAVTHEGAPFGDKVLLVAAGSASPRICAPCSRTSRGRRRRLVLRATTTEGT